MKIALTDHPGFDGSMSSEKVKQAVSSTALTLYIIELLHGINKEANTAAEYEAALKAAIADMEKAVQETFFGLGINVALSSEQENASAAEA